MGGAEQMSSPKTHLGPHERLTAIINPNQGPIMKPFLALVFSLVLLFCGCGTATTPADAIAEIKKLGGKVSLNKSGEVIQVILSGQKITDAGLEHLKSLTSLMILDLKDTQVTDAGLKHLNGLTSLTVLFLDNTQITDAGLVHLKGLTSLNALFLDNTQVTDAGLEHLQGLTSLNTLFLRDTKITDAGLEDLKCLTKLEVMVLRRTQVTDVGLSELKAALPKCKVVK